MENNHFLIVGGMRCGSSYLAGLLDDHPEICMAHPYIGSEPKFFIKDDIEHKEYADYYNEYFTKAKKFQLLGEKSVSYLETKQSPKIIKSMLDNAKIIIILRNPVDRAISHYYYSLKNGLEKRSLVEAFEYLEDLIPSDKFGHISMPPFNYLSRGIYAQSILRYVSVFGHEKVYLETLENFSDKDKNSLSDLLRFLGVDSDFTPMGYGEKINQSTPENHATPPWIIENLRAYFAPLNLKLSEEYSLDLRSWGV